MVNSSVLTDFMFVALIWTWVHSENCNGISPFNSMIKGLSEDFRKRITHLKIECQKLSSKVGKISVIFYLALYMTYNFLYIVHTTSKFCSVRKWKTNIKISLQQVPSISGNLYDFFCSAQYMIHRIYIRQVKKVVKN